MVNGGLVDGWGRGILATDYTDFLDWFLRGEI